MNNIQKKHTTLNVSVNYFCNQKCIFCNEGKKIVFKHLKGNEDKIVYNVLKENIGKYKNIVFTSGEPTLNKNIGEYIKKAKKLGYKKVSLITNGTTIYENVLRKKLLDSGLNEITLSIHGSNASVHEKNVGVKGVYTNVILGLIKLRKESRKIKINISMVLNKYNLFDLFNSILKYNKLGVDTFLVNTMRPEGYGEIRMKDLSIKYNEFVDYINSLSNKNIRFLNYLIKKRKLNIMDIPICFLEKTNLDIGVYGKVEIRIIENDIKNKNNKKYIKKNTKDDKIYLNKCKKCKYLGNCEGVYQIYIETFGKKEFSSC